MNVFEKKQATIKRLILVIFIQFLIVSYSYLKECVIFFLLNENIFFNMVIMLQKTLSEVERDLKNSEPASKTQMKGKRMVIQEVENSEDEDGKDSGRKHEDSSEDKSKTSFLFWLCKKLSFYMMSYLKFCICTEILSLSSFS